MSGSPKRSRGGDARRARAGRSAHRARVTTGDGPAISVAAGVTCAPGEVPFVRGAKRVLLLNPPTADTIGAEDLKMLSVVAPFGLLRLATWFRRQGCEVDLVDCMREAEAAGSLRRHVRKTLPCGDDGGPPIRKNVYHFGLDAAALRERLAALAPPDVVAVSSVFTWTAEATRDAITVCKEVFPRAKVLLGGNFATLCPEAAAQLGADAVVSGDIPDAIFQPTAIDLVPGPHPTDYVSMVKGCPNHCEYCVTNFLNGGRVMTRPPEAVLAEMKEKIAAHGTRTFIFFDDFIQYKQPRFLDPLLDMVSAEGLAVNLEFALGFASYMITEPFAQRLRRARVERIALALETISATRSEEMQRPQSLDEFIHAAEILRAAGYQGENIRAFYLIGLPGQTTREILRGIGFLYSLGVAPSLTTYTLAPGSGDWDKYSHLVAGRPLDELAPCLWRFAHPGMKVRELDAIYRYFHETYFPIERLLASPSDDPVILQFQSILQKGEHLPDSW
jgi:hypothetical protein